MSGIELDIIVFPHFRRVIGCLGWRIDSNLQTLESECHYFIKFQMRDLVLIYRYAKYSKKQILSQTIAYQIAGDLVPKIYYTDENSIIEEFVHGLELNVDCDDLVLEKVAYIIDRLHQLKMNGFGRLETPTNATMESWDDYNFSIIENLSSIEASNLFSAMDFKRFKTYMMSPPLPSDLTTKVCHGDICLRNILYSSRTKDAQLIDWEQVSANYREFDFVLLASFQDPKSKEIYDKIKTFYPHDLNEELIIYFKLRRVVSSYKTFKEDISLLNAMNSRLLEYRKYFV
ncbi:MAG: phosphotransferase [Candidatus Cloacimonetes bacterium]|nr:phosphotransferase [Candidatus Cloacimonadota bacterium]